MSCAWLTHIICTAQHSNICRLFGASYTHISKKKKIPVSLFAENMEISRAMPTMRQLTQHLTHFDKTNMQRPKYIWTLDKASNYLWVTPWCNHRKYYSRNWHEKVERAKENFKTHAEIAPLILWDVAQKASLDARKRIVECNFLKHDFIHWQRLLI